MAFELAHTTIRGFSCAFWSGLLFVDGCLRALTALPACVPL
jgi:hypothetical protein